MNNLYAITKDSTICLTDGFGAIDDGYLPTGFDNSLLLEADGTDRKKRIESRHHKRYKLNKDAFALVRSIFVGPLKIDGQSMGCIAGAVFNSRPARLGKIDNISMGGLTFQHVNTKIQTNFALVLDILLADAGFYLSDIPFTIITDILIPEDIPEDSIEMRRVRLEFQKLDANQEARLKDFIFHYGD